MRTLIVAAVWTAIWLAAAILWPAPINTPGCAHLLNPPASCAAELDAANTQLWLTHTLPLCVLLVVGYLAIWAASLRKRRRGRGTP
jgi:hypothetical protein